MTNPFESGALALLADDVVDRLLDGELPPSMAPAGYGKVAEVVALAHAASVPTEHAAEASTIAMMSAIVTAQIPPPQPVPSRSNPRRRPSLAKVLLAKVAVAVALGGVAVTGAAAADLLPAPMQDAIADAADHVGVSFARSSSQPSEGPAPTASMDGTVPGGTVLSTGGDNVPPDAASTGGIDTGGLTPAADTAPEATNSPPADGGGTIPGNAYGNGGVPGNGNANGLGTTKSDNGVGNGGVPGNGHGRPEKP